MASLQPISCLDIQQVLTRFSSAQCHSLMQEVAPAFRTRQLQSKWDKSIDSACIHCGAEDTRWHRVFDCPAYSDIREHYRDTVDYYLARDTTIHELPVIHVPRVFAFHEQMFFSHPEITFDSGAG